MKATWVQMVLLACVVAFVTGCDCKPSMVERDVKVSLDESLRESDGRLKSVQVDVIAVSDAELQRWQTVPVDTYWAPGGSGLFTTADKKTLAFSFQENVTSKTLPATDPVWNNWKQKGAMDLVLVARIPGLSGGGGAGAADPRRLIITLNGCRWDDTKKPLEIRVSSAGLTSLSQPKPPKK